MQKIRKGQIRCGNQQQGFSAIELAVVIAVIGLIAAIAVPGFLGMRERYKLRSSATDVLSAMKRAQSEAVKRDTSVTVLFTAGACIVFVDNGAGAGGVPSDSNRNGTEATLFTTTIKPGTTLPTLKNTFPFNTETTPLKNTRFNRRGVPAFTGSLDIVSANLTVQYRVILYTSGHATLQVSTDSGTAWH